VDDDIAFSLSCRRKHLAVNVEPIADLGMQDPAALYRQPGHAAKRQAAVDRYLRYLAEHPAPEAQLAAAQARLSQVEAERAALQAELSQLRATVS
jgi:septal ring factor EnvC (AmiA/AmiB activator)